MESLALENAGSGLADDISPRLRNLLSEAGRELVYYEGSLTVPPCSQRVSRVVFLHKFPINDAQLDLIQSYLSKNADGSVVGNYRNTQPIGNRPFFYINNYNYIEGPILSQIPQFDQP